MSSRLRGFIILAVIIVFLTLSALAFVVFRNMSLDTANSALKSADYQTAYEELKPLLWFGDNKAESIVGYMYAYGWGVERNFNSAKYWFRRSTKLGGKTEEHVAELSYYVGVSFKEGVGVTNDESLAMWWINSSAKSCYMPALNMLINFYSTDLNNKKKWINIKTSCFSANL